MQEGAVLEQNAVGAPSRLEREALLSLPSDHYSRYALTHSIIEGLRSQLGGGLRILDVGGHSSPLAHFLPNDSITLLDVEPEGSLTSAPLVCDAYIQGSGANLPFRDAAFDVVTAHDTLEHVPPDLRALFMEEIIRVSSRVIILSGPVFGEKVVAAEQRIDRFVQDTLGWRQPFLGEHIELGLPRPHEIEAAFYRRDLPVTTIESGDLDRWVVLLAIRHYLAALPDSENLRQAIDRSYNALVQPGEPVTGNSYRVSYVAAKDEGVAAALPGLAGRVAAITPPTTESAVALEGLLAALEEHAGSVGGEFRQLHEARFEAETKAYALQGTHDELAKSLGDREAEVRELRGFIAQQEEELEQLRTIARSLPGRFANWRPYRRLESSARDLLRKRKEQR